MALKRNFSRYAATSDTVYLFHDLQDYLNSEIPTGISSIAYGFGTLDTQLIRRDSATLIVVFHAAANPATLTLPIFIGHKITRETDASVLFVSDPSLDFRIPSGWFAGDAARPLQQDLVKVIRHVSQSVLAKHIIFQGSSAGGFASMFYSHEFPGSLAIAVNPQTNLRNHYPERVNPYLNACWADLSDQPVPTLDLLELYEESFPNFLLYLQNRRDSFHIEHHYTPWANAFDGLFGERWSTLAGDWGDGHAAPPPFFQAAIFDFALSFQGDWAELLRSDDFEATPGL